MESIYWKPTIRWVIDAVLPPWNEPRGQRTHQERLCGAPNAKRWPQETANSRDVPEMQYLISNIPGYHEPGIQDGWRDLSGN